MANKMCKRTNGPLYDYGISLSSENDTKNGIRDKDGEYARGACSAVPAGEPVVGPQEFEFCKRCGRKLKSVEARQKGLGPICEKKMRLNEAKKLF